MYNFNVKVNSLDGFNLSMDKVLQPDGVKVDESRMDTDQFGACPVCRQGAHIMRDVGREHYAVCEADGVYWHIGSNLFSGWLFQTPAEKAENVAYLYGLEKVLPSITQSCQYCGAMSADMTNIYPGEYSTNGKSIGYKMCPSCYPNRYDVQPLRRKDISCEVCGAKDGVYITYYGDHISSVLCEVCAGVESDWVF
jgi:hypothetical protein